MAGAPASDRAGAAAEGRPRLEHVDFALRVLLLLLFFLGILPWRMGEPAWNTLADVRAWGPLLILLALFLSRASHYWLSWCCRADEPARCCCCCCRRRAGAAAAPAGDPHGAPKAATAAAPAKVVEHYLEFLKTCRNLFCLLSLISFPWVSCIWGARCYLWFLAPANVGRERDCWNLAQGAPPESASAASGAASVDAYACLFFEPALTTHLDKSLEVLSLLSMVCVKSVLAFYFAHRYQEHTKKSRRRRTDKENRTLWLSKIPVKDHSTLRQHQMTLDDFVRVENNLRKEISKHLGAASRAHEDANLLDTRIDTGPIPCGVLECGMVCNIACVFCPPCGGGAARPEAAARRLRRSSLVVPGAPAPRADSSDQPSCAREGRESSSTPAPVPGAKGPAEGAAKGPAACIEDIVVLPEMEAHLQLTSEFARMMRSFDQWKSYQKELPGRDESPCQDNSNESSGWCSKYWRRFRYCVRNPLTAYFESRRDCWGREFDELRHELEMKYEIYMANLQSNTMAMSGHAFVVFEKDEHRNFMLEPVPVFKNQKNFKFGIVPFSSVTLACRSAPHPEDIWWDNLHKADIVWRGVINYITLVVFTAVVVFLIAIADKLDKLDTFACQHLRSSHALQEFVCGVSAWMKRNVLAFHQLPYVVLVMFNSLVVPCWIEAMQRARSPFRRSFVDLKGISTNLQLLLFSKLVMPFVSLVLADLVVFQTRGPTEVPVDLHDVEGIIEEPAYNVVGEVGSFYITYTLTCAFVSPAISVLQLGRWFCAWWFSLPWRGRTDADLREAKEPYSFAYGYWYGWSLSIFGIGLVTSTVLPAMAPVTFITFGLKHHVDSILLTKLYAFRDDNTVTLGDYPPHVAHHMYSTVAWTMMIQAAGAVLFMTVGASPEERFNSVWIWSLAKLLVALGAVLLPLSFWNAWQVDKKENFPDQPEEREHLHAPVLLRLARRTVDVVHEFIVASPYGGGREPLLPDGGARADPAGAAADGPGHGGHDGSEELSWNATKCFADAVLRRTPLRSEPGPGLDAHGSPEVVDWPALAGKLCGLLGGKVVSTDGMPMRFERAIRRSGDDLDDDGMVVDLPALLEGPACWSAP